MPHIEIMCYPGRTEEEKKQCAERITEAVTETLGCGASSVSVAVREVPQELWKERVWDRYIAPGEERLVKKPGYTCDGDSAAGRPAGDGTALGVLSARRSYRGKFLPARVPREDLQQILQAGLDAPSGCNKQTTSLIAVDDPEVLAKLRTEIDPPVAETAPAVICVLTQRICAYRDRCFAVQDYSAAIENMLLAAEALGYSSCWYEGHITDEDRIGDRMARILGVPEEYELVCMLPVGVAAEGVRAPRKKAFGERAWFNGFGAGADA